MPDDPEPQPNIGEMYLYDAMPPPFEDGSYRLDASTVVTVQGVRQDLPGGSGYFDVFGPRFALSATEVGGVFPPVNARGSFSNLVPHIALKRRTLPWERPLDSRNTIGSPAHRGNDPGPPAGPRPWLALLLLEEGEYTLLRNVPVEDVVPSDVLRRMDPDPRGALCDAVRLGAGLLFDILPSVEELQLLTHVRHVNTDDRELSAGDSGGWYSVVMGNRLPRPNAECRACLVSLEERTDLVSKDPPPVDPGLVAVGPVPPFRGEAGLPVGAAARRGVTAVEGRDFVAPLLRQETLVVLYSWKFFNEGYGSFHELMQRLDVATAGTVRDDRKPRVLDTGHLPVALQNRDGVTEQVLYRGPLVAAPLSRDPLGPYHSADQARRVAVEAGAEDVSYAAAFEVGRLLAAGDGRLAQELLRWRQDGYRQSVRADALARASRALGITDTLDLHTQVVPVLAGVTVQRVLEGVGPLGDPYGLNHVHNAPGLNPAAVQKAWNLADQAQAAVILGQPAGTVAPLVESPPGTVRAATDINAVAADAAALGRLAAARDRVIANVKAGMGGPP
jgi:hypothetical protein